MGHNNVIELNGKRYDAITGAYIGKSHSMPVPAAPAKTGRSIDGVKPRARTTVPDHKKESPHKSGHNPHTPSRSGHQPPAPAKKPASKPRQAGAHTKAHKPQRTNTLMRSVVKKPDTKPAANSKITKQPDAQLERKKAVHTIHPVRLERSRQTPKSQQIQRFAAPVRYAPTPVARPQPAERAQTSAHAPLFGQSKPAQHADIFEAAIAHAVSHTQKPFKLKPSRTRRAAHAAVIAVAVLAAIGGLIWWQKPNIELRLASFQAGFQASNPSHQLEGFTREGARQVNGEVIISYHSGNRYYEVTQQKSGWNSQALLETSVLGATSEDPVVLESRGRIVYLYKNSEGSWRASWMDRGIRHDITGNAHITREDIAAIVDSI